jgi:hypothetical protein
MSDTYHEHSSDSLGIDVHAEAVADVAADADEAAPEIDPTDPEWMMRATSHLRHLRRAERQLLDARRAFDAEIDRLERKREEIDAVFERRLEWHRRPLRDLHRALLEVDPTRKTVVLPYGALQSRTPQKPTMHVVERDEFVRWARDHAPDLLAVSFSPDRKAIEKAIGATLAPAAEPARGESVPIVTADGELVPGVVQSLGESSFTVRLDDGEDEL